MVESLFELAGLIGPFVSILLTGLLVWLYRQQKQILERQTKLTESNHRAILRVRTYNLFSWRDLHYFGKDTGLDISELRIPGRYSIFTAYISNAGKGTAENMRAELVLKTSSETYSVTSPLSHMTNIDQIAFNDKGGVLAPADGESLMVSKFSFSSDNFPDLIEESDITIEDNFSPSEFLWILEDMGVSYVEIAIFIHYEDGTGMRAPIQLLTSKHSLEPYLDIRTAYEWGGPIDHDLEPIFHED